LYFETRSLLVERLAREELGLAREGDVVFVVPEASAPPPPAFPEP
jgi:cell division protein FtsB